MTEEQVLYELADVVLYAAMIPTVALDDDRTARLQRVWTVTHPGREGALVFSTSARARAAFPDIEWGSPMTPEDCAAAGVDEPPAYYSADGLSRCGETWVDWYSEEQP